MAIPTAGLTPATNYSVGATTWNASITLIGDSENLIGENASGETATLGRPMKQLADNVGWVRGLSTHAATSVSIIMPGTNDDFNYVIPQYWRKTLRYKLTMTLQENLTLNGSYDEFFDFSNLFGIDEIDINLNGKIVSSESGVTAKTNLFYFKKCSVPLLQLRNGTIQDLSGNFTNLINFENCIGNMTCDALITIATTATNHYVYNYSRGIIKNGTLTSGKTGIIAQNTATILSQDNTTAVTCDVYGLRAETGGTIRKYDATQPAGTSANESEATGGLID